MRRTLILALGIVLGMGETALAGGLYLPTRGVRPTARAGAFVAGADDLGALWFNPAGLVAPPPPKGKKPKKASFLFDMAYVDQAVTYERLDSGNNMQPAVSDDAPGKPIPTIGLGYRVSDKLSVAAGLFAPYAASATYPEDGPQRYSLIDTNETVLVIVEAAVAYRVSDRLRIGAGVQNMISQLSTVVVFSGCPQEVTCAPEDPEFDSLNKFSQLDLFAPSGVVGLQYDLSKKATAGVAFQFPFSISGSGEFQSRLPSSGFYDGAELVGDDGELSFNLPPILRAGIELRPSPRLRVELAGSIEFWSVHDTMTIEPRNVRIENTPGLGTYEFSTVEIAREFQNSYALALGGELKLSDKLALLGGYSFESSAVRKRTLSVLTVDGNKHLLSAGASLGFGSWSIDAAVAFVSVADRSVSPEEGRARQLTPLRDVDDVENVRTYVNWGDYSSSWLVAGLGIRTAF